MTTAQQKAFEAKYGDLPTFKDGGYVDRELWQGFRDGWQAAIEWFACQLLEGENYSLFEKIIDEYWSASPDMAGLIEADFGEVQSYTFAALRAAIEKVKEND